MNDINPKALELLDYFSEVNNQGWHADVRIMIEELNITSPIEQMFYIQWEFLDRHKIRLLPQHKIGPYKVDFYIYLLGYFEDHPFFKYPDSILKKLYDFMPRIVVELDGHDFHEKTKEQAEADKKRQRFITREGYTVYRFTGREIHKSKYDCAMEMRVLVEKALTDACAKLVSNTL